MLEKHYAKHSITPTEPQTNLKFSCMYVQDIQLRVEKYGSLSRLEEIAKYGGDEEFYDLDDGFVVPDTDAEEAGTQQHFERALEEGFYVAKLAELRIECDAPPPPKADVRIEVAAEKPKEKPAPIFSKKMSQLLAKILIARDSVHTPLPMPYGSPKLLDQLASQMLNEPHSNVEEVLTKLQELAGSISVAYTRAVFDSMARASQQISQQNFDFAPLRELLDSFRNPQSNELTASLIRLQTILQDYMMRSAVDDLMKKKSAVTSQLLKEVKRLAAEKKPITTDEFTHLMTEAEKQVRAFVRLNNEYVAKYPLRCGKKALDESKEVADLWGVVKAASQVQESVAVAKKRSRDDANESRPIAYPEWSRPSMNRPNDIHIALPRIG